MALSALRWLVFLPLGFGASVLASVAAANLGETAGGATWYTWLISGVAAAYTFFFVAFRVAPQASASVTWVCIALVGVFGVLAALGHLLRPDEPIRAVTGLGMLLVALDYARRPLRYLRTELAMNKDAGIPDEG